MNKAEELKQQAKVPKGALLAILTVLDDENTSVDMKKDKKYCFSESELNEYANEVNREKGREFARHLNMKKPDIYDFIKYFETYWKQKQEEDK